MKTKLKISEREMQASIIEYLKLEGWFVHRINSGFIPMSYKGKQRMIRLGSSMPDLMAFSQDKGFISLLFIEVKREGAHPTALQTAKMKELQRFGAKCLIIHSLEELKKENV